MEQNQEKQIKSAVTAGADERTPSRSQYFSWINSTNEGSTEAQTLANIGYFKWLRDESGMTVDIYAWDAGNLDGSSSTYETLDSPKLRAQYPNGYGKCAEAAAEIGMRLGVWCGPDGYGDTDESAAARRELLVSLCRDHHFALFKIDGVCSRLRPEKQEEFVKTMKECRKYSPDLILLNHRLRLGIGEPYATTFLWNGQETYVDVHIGNDMPAPHHRAFMFFRGTVPELQRLAEDHGVCISSFNDFFDDDLIFQAFGRCLILAPEIYGNPWLLPDRDHARLARIYNLHRTYRDILVNGKLLPDCYGPDAVSRGDGKRRIIVAGNPTWERVSVPVRLDSEIGLEKCDKVAVMTHHPYEEFIGVFDYETVADVPVPPFRAGLIEVCDAAVAGPFLTGCKYEVIKEKDGVPTRVKLVASSGRIGVFSDGKETALSGVNNGIFDFSMRDPVRVDHVKWEREPVTAKMERLYEAAIFASSNDSLEAQALKSAGETAIPQVKAARDAFFAQKTYVLRGCESRFAFDGDPDTFFDGGSKTFYDGYMRKCGTCLRVDFGAKYQADKVIIEYFKGDVETNEIKPQSAYPFGDYSTDLAVWNKTTLIGETPLCKREQEVVVNDVHNIEKVPGQVIRAEYAVNGQIRYLRIREPLDRIYKIALEEDGNEISLDDPKLLIMLPHFRDRKIVGARRARVFISKKDIVPGAYLSVCIKGEHNPEGAYGVIEIDGKEYGCPDRASSYPAMCWECGVRDADRGYTYYLPLTPEMAEKEINVFVLEFTEEAKSCDLAVRLCFPRDGAECPEIDI